MPAFDRPTSNRLIEILRQNDEAGDILCGYAADEIERLRLTDEERAAIESAIWDYEQNDDDADCARMVAMLRGLLDRHRAIGHLEGRPKS